MRPTSRAILAVRTPSNSWMVDLAGILAIVHVLIILLMFHLFRRTYDLLGFAPKNVEADPGHIYHTQAQNYANAAKKVRKFSELLIHLVILAQMVLLVAAWQAPKIQEPNKTRHATPTRGFLGFVGVCVWCFHIIGFRAGRWARRSAESQPIPCAEPL